jgi:hypothetical protein
VNDLTHVIDLRTLCIEGPDQQDRLFQGSILSVTVHSHKMKDR